jgi:ribosomal protein S18 acetylase RimI-like enzyme
MNFTIRTMTARDHDEVAALWRSCPGVGLSDSDTRGGVTRFLDANPGLSFVALDGDRLVGAVLCGHDGRRGYVTHLAVAPEARRGGLGRELVERCLAALRREGIQKCHLFVFADNESAQAFWTAAGWSERPELRVFSRFIVDERD